jgi:hypothetical protein
VVAASLAAALCVGSVASSAATAPRASAVREQARAFPLTYHLWGGARDIRLLARYDLVVGYAYWDVRALRRANPTGVFLLTPGLQPARPSDYRGLSITYGGLQFWTGGRDRLRGGPRLGPIRPFDPEWDVLRNADGSLALANETWRHNGWNLADPRARGTPELVAKVIAHASKRSGIYTKGWDGIHSDNWIYRIGVGWFYGPNLDTDRDGRVDDYDVLRRNWARGLTRAGVLLRTYLPGKIVGGNGNWNVAGGPGGVDFRPYLSRPDDHLRSANYTLLEELQLYARRADEIVETVGEWLAYPDPRGQQRYFAMLQRLTSPSDYRSLRWGLSLATVAGAYYEAMVSSHADMLWFDEYDGGEGVRARHWLGEPVSAPRKVGGVWRRDFRNGIVLNNSTSSSQTVRLEGAFARLRGTQDPAVNDGATVAEVTVPPLDGLFLRRLEPASAGGP